MDVEFFDAAEHAALPAGDQGPASEPNSTRDLAPFISDSSACEAESSLQVATIPKPEPETQDTAGPSPIDQGASESTQLVLTAPGEGHQSDTETPSLPTPESSNSGPKLILALRAPETPRSSEPAITPPAPSPPLDRPAMNPASTRRRPPNRPTPSRRRTPDRPHAFNFLEPDSPAVTAEAIRRSIRQSTTHWHTPGSPGSESPGVSNVFSLGESETERSCSPEDHFLFDQPAKAFHFSPDAGEQWAGYGTPEMPRGTANLPHLHPSALHQRFGPYGGYAKHLPRAEKLPLSGYQLLASKLSAGHTGEPHIPPMYRRFETLNHRILLHLQDELAELEEQLYRLDTADTQTRRLPDCILPASRRGDFMAGGELQWHRTDILGKIGYKLEQYNRVLASFQATQAMSTPGAAEVEEYRLYLDTKAPIADIETRFLDHPEDLVALHRRDTVSCETGENSSGTTTPMPCVETECFLSANSSITQDEPEPEAKPTEVVLSPIVEDFQPDVSIQAVAVALAISVLLPFLAFSSVPGFLGRMGVVFLVAVGILGPFLQATRLRGLGMPVRNVAMCAGVYGMAMGVIAALTT